MQSKIARPTAAELESSPRERVLVLAGRIGEEAVAGWCAELLAGLVLWSDPRRPSIEWLGGRHAASQLSRHGFSVPTQEYWPRVWGARGLLYAWTHQAGSAVLTGLHDPSWRVREMSAKVARRHALDSAEPILTRLLDDSHLRVRSAADAALTEMGRSPAPGRPRSSRPPRPRR